jgi:hypothetical protein
MADTTTTDNNDGDALGIPVLLGCGAVTFLMCCLNGTPLGFLDDLVLWVCKILFWPMVIYGLATLYDEQYKEAKLTNTLSRPKGLQ